MKNKLKQITNNAKETQKLGKELAENVLKLKPLKTAVIIGFEGDLGSGKTTFLQGFAKGLGIKEKILSPTFVILKHLKITKSRYTDFYHVDCYRLKKKEELLGLGFKKIVSNPSNIVAIEWVGQIKKILPRKTIFVSFKFIKENKREITINNF